MEISPIPGADEKFNYREQDHIQLGAHSVPRSSGLCCGFLFQSCRRAGGEGSAGNGNQHS